MLRELHGYYKELVADKTDIIGSQDNFSSKAKIRAAFINTFTFWGMDD